MRLLLDTHVVIWWLEDDRRLGSRARALIADPETDALFSIVSCWEASVKFRTGKMDIGGPQLWTMANEAGFIPLGLEPRHLDAHVLLPNIDGHRDPFDHLLLAQAQTDADAIMTHDRALPAYGIPCIGVR